MIEAEDDVTALGQLKAVHRKERKELQSKIMNMKHSVGKNDKKRKKEIATEIAKLEEEMKRRHEEELAQLESSLPEISAEPAIVEEQCQEKVARTSKAQKRREKKAEIKRKQEEATLQARIDAESAPRKLESEAIERYLIDRGLKIYNIEPNGDCLYSAIAHQLSLVTSRQFASADIRQKAAAYMRMHKDDFLPFLIGDNGEGVDEIDFEEYCMRVEKCCTDGGVWGGEPELRATACALERQIEVIQPGGCPLTFGECSDRKPLVITFHRFAYSLGEHYNSTAPSTVIVVPEAFNQ